MSKPKILSTVFTTLILGVGAGYAIADEVDASMEESGAATMSGFMDDAMSESGDSMENSADSGMSESMSEEDSDMSGDMADGDALMGESDSMDED